MNDIKIKNKILDLSVYLKKVEKGEQLSPKVARGKEIIYKKRIEVDERERIKEGKILKSPKLDFCTAQ